MSLSILSLWEKGKRYHFSSRMKQLPLPPGERRAGLPLTRQCHGGRCKEAWVPAYAGRTLWPPHPAVPWAPPASPAVGRGVLDCCLRRNDTGTPSPGQPGRLATLSRKGRGGLDCCLRRKDTGAVQRSLGSCLRRKDTRGPPQAGRTSFSSRRRWVCGSVAVVARPNSSASSEAVPKWSN